MADEYPEHEKLKAVKDRSQAIGEFLDWLANEKGYELAVRHNHTESCHAEDGGLTRYCGARQGELLPVNTPIRTMLAEFFEIDERRLDDEKRAMLEKLRSGVVG